MRFYAGMSYEDILNLTLPQLWMLLQQMVYVEKFFNPGDGSNSGTQSQCRGAADKVGIDVPEKR